MEASCDQALARDSCYTAALFVSMGPVDPAASSADTGGGGELPWAAGYKQAHWLAGMAGQQLYCAAEAAGLGVCGMGCYLDDLPAQVTPHALLISNRPPFSNGSRDFTQDFGATAGWPCLYCCAVGNKLPAGPGGAQPYHYSDRVLPPPLDASSILPVVPISAAALLDDAPEPGQHTATDSAGSGGDSGMAVGRQLAGDLRIHGFAVLTPCKPLPLPCDPTDSVATTRASHCGPQVGRAVRWCPRRARRRRSSSPGRRRRRCRTHRRRWRTRCSDHAGRTVAVSRCSALRFRPNKTIFDACRASKL